MTTPKKESYFSNDLPLVIQIKLNLKQYLNSLKKDKIP